MPLSNADRQKRYRERLKIEKPERYEELRVKHLEKVKKNTKKASELSDEERKKQREKWKKANDKRALKSKGTTTTPTTLSNQKSVTLSKSENVTTKHLKRLKAQNEELERKNKNLKRQLYRYKAEIENLKKKLASQRNPEPISAIVNESEIASHLTPMTKTSSFLDEIPSISEEDKDKVKKKLLLLNTLTDSLQDQYNKADTIEKKKTLKRVALGETVKKYKLKGQVSSSLGLKGKIRMTESNKNNTKKYMREIHSFFNRDNVSRPTAGKQECKTKNKEKKQKRYLLDTVQQLHAKYRSEGGRASLATFARYRPFYVITPKIKDRNTCACIKHANIGFKALKLKKLGVLKTSNIDDLIKMVACRECFDCMYNKCRDCMNKTPDINSKISGNAPVQWLQWRLRSHTYSVLNKNKIEVKTTKKYTKEVVSETVKTLTDVFLKDLQSFKTHHYNIRHQYMAYKKCIENLGHDEVAIVCDFSENYMCKQSEEIQAVHFGASRNQITLHTCVLYQKDANPKPICSISPVNEHGPGAIWAHLDCILKYCKNKPNIKKIHVFSDGPTTQYKQKHNFYLFTKRLTDYGFEHGTWNFFEASHGKGPADGVGGAIKRKLDQHIAHGHDITTAGEAYSYLLDHVNVDVYYVSETDIKKMTQMIPDDVIPLKGTMKLHQVIYDRQNKHKIYYRTLSCICDKDKPCVCGEGIKHHKLIQLRETNDLENKKSGQKNERQNRESTITKSRERIPLQSVNNNTKISTNKKVTVLSSIKLKSENRPFVGSEMMPLQLRSIDKEFDIFTGHVLNEESKLLQVQKSQKPSKRPIETDKKKKVINKRMKRTTRSLSSSSTSDESNMSLYSDSELVDMDEDLFSDEDNNLQVEYGVTNVQMHTVCKTNFKGLEDSTHNILSRNLNQEETKIVTNKLSESKLEKEVEKEKVVKPFNIEDENAILPLETDRETENVNKKEMEIIDNNTEFVMRCEIVNIDKMWEHTINIETNDQDADNLSLKTSESVKENAKDEYSINETVLVRYYEKKSWKFYIGVIKHINFESDMYTVLFYKTVGRNENLKFIVPKRTDRDIVPHDSIVKKIQLQLHENSKDYILLSLEDSTYFK